MTIHPTAIVEDGARLADGVTVGPYCVVGPGVTLEEGVELLSQVAVAGATRIGAGTRVWPFASLGQQPQDLKYRGEPTRLEIGPGCMIREQVTINTGTAGGGGVTRIGAGCLVMAGCHVAHDCRLEAGVVLASHAALGGHVDVGEHAVIGGLSGVHQHVRIGAHAFVGGCSGVDRDVIPYGAAVGNRAVLAGLNLVGLKRRGFERAALESLRAAYRMIFESGGKPAERAAEAAAAYPESQLVQRLAAFVRAGAARHLCLPRDA
ncbi:MAG TPA: acyl-ACP--UDP-N-acetylglucosamine O-acyltransferase [Thermohalobaculum sp.]|nr:acyl-ACP--UDP-N-acetylglucosamine O-acyltransferase [Thermohalobaculum sp.]